jgi:transposase
MARERRQFSAEFKREAVRLVADGGRTASEVARSLDIRADLLRQWQRQFAAAADPPRGLSGPRSAPEPG